VTHSLEKRTLHNIQVTQIYVYPSGTPILAVFPWTGAMSSLLATVSATAGGKKRQVLRNSGRCILLLNLALADLAFLVVCVPFTAVKYAAPSWPLGETSCRIVNYLPGPCRLREHRPSVVRVDR